MGQDTTSSREQEPRYSRDSSVFLRRVARIIHPNAPPNCLGPSLPDCLLPKSISLIYIIPPPKKTVSFGGGGTKMRETTNEKKKYPGKRFTFAGLQFLLRRAFADETAGKEKKKLSRAIRYCESALLNICNCLLICRKD